MAKAEGGKRRDGGRGARRRQAVAVREMFCGSRHAAHKQGQQHARDGQEG